jgi:thioredoxin 1
MGFFGDLLKPREKVIPAIITDADFRKEVLASDKPVIVDFHSPACGPCKRLAPVLIDVATEFADEVKVVAMDVRRTPKTNRRFGVRSTPTVLIIEKGKEKGRVVGYRPKKWFQEMIRTELLGEEPTVPAT